MMTTQIEAVEQSNTDTLPEYRVLCDGLEIRDENAQMTVTVKKYRKMYERVKGDTYATWTVMVNITDDCGKPFHSWGVFMLTARSNGWSLFGGDYFHTEEEALTRYHERGGE